MVMPKKTRFRMALILSAGGAIIASGATAPTVVEAKKPTDEKVQVNAGQGLDWEKSAPTKRPPNGKSR